MRDFEQVYDEVRPTVLKCYRQYYIHGCELSDWDQEGMLQLYYLLKKHPRLECDDKKLHVYYKTRFKNYIIDKIREQLSNKRKINQIEYIDIWESSHRISSGSMEAVDYLYYREQIKSYASSLGKEGEGIVRKLEGDERFCGRKGHLRALRSYLEELGPTN